MKSLNARSLRCLAVAAASLSAVPLYAQANSATVVYVSGNQVVVNQASNGLDYGYTLGAGDKVKTAAGDVPTSGLKVGTVITGGLKSGGHVVDDAVVTPATVVSVAGPGKAVVKVGGENKEVTFADGALGSAKAGDSVNLTLVSVRTDGDNRPMNSVKAPAMSGTLAFFQEPNMEQPDSGSSLPLFGAIGAVLLALGFGLRARSPLAK